MKRILLLLLVLMPLLAAAQGVIRQSRNQSNSQTPATVSEPTGYADGHGYVDLGLSVKWATMNVGASSPSDYGDYYAWGETSTKSSYTKDNSRMFNRKFKDIAGDPTYDAARANWGGRWRLPTKAELQELLDKCTWTWSTIGDHKGYIIKSKTNGRSIFLPAAGWRYGRSLHYDGVNGYCWSSTPAEGTIQDARYLYFNSFGQDVGSSIRYIGHTVRAVLE